MLNQFKCVNLYTNSRNLLLECKFVKGDGKSKLAEIEMRNIYKSEQACAAAVKSTWPSATGATWATFADSLYNHGSGKCYAEFEIYDTKGNSGYRTCMFGKGKGI